MKLGDIGKKIADGFEKVENWLIDDTVDDLNKILGDGDRIINCPKCDKEQEIEKDKFKCKYCGRNFKITDKED